MTISRADDQNNGTLERIYPVRRFRNDNERLEELLEMFTNVKMQVPS
jgi:hypothetical protein